MFWYEYSTDICWIENCNTVPCDAEIPSFHWIKVLFVLTLNLTHLLTTSSPGLVIEACAIKSLLLRYLWHLARVHNWLDLDGSASFQNAICVGTVAIILLFVKHCVDVLFYLMIFLLVVLIQSQSVVSCRWLRVWVLIFFQFKSNRILICSFGLLCLFVHQFGALYRRNYLV